jgi:HlyD family secretion protein
VALAGALLFAGACADDVDGALDASGTVEATEADLGFQIPGRVVEVTPAEGDRVAAGDTLARLDAEELEAAVDAADAAVDAARARLAELRAGSRPQELEAARAAVDAALEAEAQARRDEARTRRLHAGGAVSDQALEQAATRLETARSATVRAEQALALAREGARVETLAAQSAVVAQAEAAARQVRASLARTALVAPRAGLVTVRHREPGEILSPGQPVVTVMDPGDRWVRIYVREDRVGRVSLGQGATITVDAFPDRTFTGAVSFIGSEAEFTPRNVQTPDERTQLVYPVKVRITGDEALALKPGLPADVLLDGGGGA